jgi:secretion/DNA translocation related TadE-like protein
VTTRSERQRAADSGFATVWVLTAMVAVIATAAAMIAVGVAIYERHRAADAADAVALKVALDAVQGPAVACRDGAALGRLDGAAVSRCTLNGSISEVEVTVRLPAVLRLLGVATGRARAGPASITSVP